MKIQKKEIAPFRIDPTMRLFMVKHQTHSWELDNPYVLNNGDLGVWFAMTEGEIKRRYAELLEAVPDIETLWKEKRLDSDPRIRFLDQSGPVTLSMHSGGGSMSECAYPGKSFLMKNEQEARILQQRIEAMVDLGEDFCVLDKPKQGLTLDEMYAEILDEYEEFSPDEEGE